MHEIFSHDLRLNCRDLSARQLYCQPQESQSFFILALFSVDLPKLECYLMKQIFWHPLKPDELLELLDGLVNLSLVSIHLSKKPVGIEDYVWLVFILEAFGEETLGKYQVAEFKVRFGTHDVELAIRRFFAAIIILQGILSFLLAFFILALKVELVASLQEGSQGLVFHRSDDFDRARKRCAIL